MEKIIKIIVSGLLSLGGVGATVATVQEAKSNNPVEITVVPDSPETTQESSQTKVSVEEAKATALNKVNGTIISQSEDDDDYEFKIQKDGYIYDIDVDKKTGKIDDIDKERVKTATTQITFEQAKKLALAKVNGKIVSSETDDDEYKFEISKDNYLYEIEVSRKTGKITDIEKEIIQSKTSVISYEQAKSIALKQVNGTIHSIDYDDDDQEYSVEIIKDHVEYEVEIDAMSGKVIKVEKDD